MDTRVFTVIVGIGATLGASIASAAQHEGPQAASVGAPQGTAEVAQCTQAQPVVNGLVEAALKRLEEARLTNSAASMRDATDDVQAALVDVRAQLAPCAQMQAAGADAQAGHGMPNVQQAPAAPTAPAPAGVDPHAGHATPATPPAATTPRAGGAARPPTTPQRQAPATAEPHAGHTMPPAASAPAATPPRASSSTRESAARPGPPTNIADLKCTNRVDPKTAPRMLYQGRMYYFCSEHERAEFAKDPAKYATAPAQAAPAHGH